MKKIWLIGMIAILSLFITACNSTDSASGENDKEDKEEKTETTASEEGTQTITYLEEDYEVPANVEDIATASLESMEDAAVLGVKPMATITYGGEIPEYVSKELEGAEDIGSKRQPSHEKLLELQPDVILGTSKFQPEVAENLNKVAPMFPVSHISSNWEENLKLMGKLTGKEDQAEDVIKTYKDDAAALQEEIKSNVEGKKIMMVRIRGGSIYVYPEDTYFNPVLYSDLGISVPEELGAVEAQEMITIEKLAEVNPDILFVQFADNENPDTPQALEDLQNNPIWQSMNASKNDQVFVNAVDPMAQGGTAWSKTAFLEVAKEKLTK